MKPARAAVAAVLLSTCVPGAAAAKPGDLDRRYGGGDGAFVSGRLEGGTAAALQRDGRLLVAGGADVPGVARLTPLGRPDRRFSGRGVVTMRTGGAAVPFAVRRDERHRVVVSAISGHPRTPPLQYLRFAPRGGARERVVHDLTLLGPIAAQAARPDGGAYLATSPGQLRAVRADGTADETFAGGTVELCRPPQRYACFPHALAVRPDARPLVVVSGPSDARLVQLTTDGQPDPAFGDGGAVALPLVPQVVHVRRDGAILLASEGRRGRPLRLLGLTADGRDRLRGFRNGVRMTGPRRPSFARPHAIVTDRRHRMYVLAEHFQRLRKRKTYTMRSFVARLSPSGAVDRRFGRRGAALVPRPRRMPRWRPSANRGAAVLLAPRRRLLVVGTQFRNGLHDPAFGCGIRDDLCASSVRVGVWRFRR